jgi:hypothetical protein
LLRGAIVKKAVTLAVIGMLVMPALVLGQARSRDDQRRRNQIRLMEGVLVQAVRLGAEEVSSEMEKFEPAGVTMLSGIPRARGFVLDTYGVFFDVEIPALNQSVVWSMMTFQRDRQVGDALDSIRAYLESTDGPNRQRAQQALQQVSKTVGPMMTPAPTRGAAAATNAAATTTTQPPPGAVAAAASPTLPGDPDALYTEAVKGTLVEAMLDHSLQMNLGPDEWLTVAARASEGPVPPSGLSEAITIILRVKGSDLSVYHADPTRRAEIREKVKVEARVF